jgi:hypothetical protein
VSLPAADGYSTGQDLLCYRKVSSLCSQWPGNLPVQQILIIYIGQVKLCIAHFRPCTSELDSYNCGIPKMAFSVNVSDILSMHFQLALFVLKN